MITCKNCGFIVNGNLKHSISSNTCPSCGTSLFGNKELKLLKNIEVEMLNNGFNFNEATLKRLSIFILNKIKMHEKPSSEEGVSAEEGIVNGFSEVEDEYGEFKERVKSEVEKDLGIESSTFKNDHDEDDDKISRLRKMAKENSILNKRGTPVRRVGSD